MTCACRKIGASGISIYIYISGGGEGAGEMYCHNSVYVSKKEHYNSNNIKLASVIRHAMALVNCTNLLHTSWASGPWDVKDMHKGTGVGGEGGTSPKSTISEKIKVLAKIVRQVQNVQYRVITLLYITRHYSRVTIGWGGVGGGGRLISQALLK